MSKGDSSRPRGLTKRTATLAGFKDNSVYRRVMLPDKQAADLRAVGPTHICVCGCNVFKGLVAFEDYELSWWYLEGECLNCDAKVILPCPIDKPGYTRED